MPLNFLQGLALSLQQEEVEEDVPQAADESIEPEGAVQVQVFLDVQVRLGGEEYEEVAEGYRDPNRQSSSPARENISIIF